MKCHKCGASVELLRSSAPAAFCPRCGAALERAAIPEAKTADGAVAGNRSDLAVLRKAAEPFTYYWSVRRLIVEQLRHWFNPVRRRRGLRQEIRLRPRGSYQTAHRDGQAWNVHIPDCCVVCGGTPGKGIFSEGWLVDNITWPLLAPLIGLALGILVALLGGVWWLPLPLMLGFLAGYLLRGKSHVHLQIRRCRDHQTVQSVPEMFAFAGSVQIRVSHPSVAQRFKLRNSIEPQTPLASSSVEVEAPGDVVRRAAYEAALRGKTGRGRFSGAIGLVGQLGIVAALLIATPFLLKYALSEAGFEIGMAITASYLYLFVGAAVLRACCKLFGDGAPDYGAAAFAAFSALAVWDGVVYFLYRMPPPTLSADMPTATLVLEGGGYIAGLLVFLFVIPAFAYVVLLDMSPTKASLVFFVQHLVTLAIVGGVLWALIEYQPVPLK